MAFVFSITWLLQQNMRSRYLELRESWFSIGIFTKVMEASRYFIRLIKSCRCHCIDVIIILFGPIVKMHLAATLVKAKVEDTTSMWLGRQVRLLTKRYTKTIPNLISAIESTNMPVRIYFFLLHGNSTHNWSWSPVASTQVYMICWAGSKSPRSCITGWQESYLRYAQEFLHVKRADTTSISWVNMHLGSRRRF